RASRSASTSWSPFTPRKARTARGHAPAVRGGNMRKQTLVALAFLVAVVLAACSSNSGGLTGKVWQLTSITEKTPAFQGVVPAADQANYTIEFKTDDTFSAKADCNMVGGSYKTTSSGGLTIVPGP